MRLPCAVCRRSGCAQARPDGIGRARRIAFSAGFRMLPNRQGGLRTHSLLGGCIEANEDCVERGGARTKPRLLHLRFCIRDDPCRCDDVSKVRRRRSCWVAQVLPAGAGRGCACRMGAISCKRLLQLGYLDCATASSTAAIRPSLAIVAPVMVSTSAVPASIMACGITVQTS